MAGALESAMDALDYNVAGKLSLHRKIENKIEFLERFRWIDSNTSSAGTPALSRPLCAS